MKLPITDKLLYDIYNLLQNTGRLLDSPRTIQEALNLESFRRKKEYRREKQGRDFRQILYYLRRKGYIRASTSQGVLLTQKGIEKVLRIKFRHESKNLRKDGRWQMVIFDIPEEKRHLRDIFREALSYLGYQRLQHSVWVCPYEVFEKTEELIQEYNLAHYVKTFLIQEIPM